MGGSQSIPTGDLTTKNVLNFILREMLVRTDLIDLYSLADPEKCKNYIILSQKAIDTLLTKINLTPLEKGSALYIQTLDGLKRLSGQDLEVHKTNCNKIAFFFIRIFQTFGALTLSVMDDTLPATDPVKQEVRPRGERGAERGLLARPLPFAPPSSPSWQQSWRGGALSPDPRYRGPSYYITAASRNENDYRILNQYLTTPSGGTADRNPMTFDRETSIVIPQETLYNNVGTDARVLNPEAVPQVLYRFRDIDGPKRISGNLSIIVSEGVYTVSLSDIKVNGERANKATGSVTLKLEEDFPRDPRPKDRNDRELPAVIVSLFKQIIAIEYGISMIQFLADLRYIDATDRTTTLTGTRIQIPYKTDNYRATVIPILYTDTIRVENKSEAIKIEAGLVIKKTDTNTYSVGLDFSKPKITPDYMRQMVDFTGFGAQKVFKASSDKSDPINDKGEKIPVYLQRRFDVLLKPAKSGAVNPGTRYAKDSRFGQIPKPYMSSSIPEGLRVDGLHAALIQSPSIKASCTARALQLLNVDAIRGNMTTQAFSNVCNTRFQLAIDHSLPAAGRPIVESYGIAAMTSLFVDGFQGSLPAISSTEKYKKFVDQMNMAFQHGEEATPAGNIGEVRDTPMEGLCRTDDRINITENVGRIRSVAIQLLARQKQHYSNVMALIYRLFNGAKIKAGAFEINPTIMSGGTAAVNRVAEDARDILAAYYSDCEKTYTQGMEIIKQQEAKKPLEPVAGPAAGLGAAPAAPAANEEEEENDYENP